MTDEETLEVLETLIKDKKLKISANQPTLIDCQDCSCDECCFLDEFNECRLTQVSSRQFDRTLIAKIGKKYYPEEFV